MLRDYALPQTSGVTSSVASLTIEANNLELCPTLVTFVWRDKPGGRPIEKPHIHLCKFVVKCDTKKLNGVFTDAIKVRFFPFSLKDRADDELQNEEPNFLLNMELIFDNDFQVRFTTQKTHHSLSTVSLHM